MHKLYADKIAYVFADKNCTLQARTTDGRYLGFSTELEFDSLLAYLDSTDKKRQTEPGMDKKYDRTFFNPKDIDPHKNLRSSSPLAAEDVSTVPVSPTKPITVPDSPSKPLRIELDATSPTKSLAVEPEA